MVSERERERERGDRKKFGYDLSDLSDGCLSLLKSADNAFNLSWLISRAIYNAKGILTRERYS